MPELIKVVLVDDHRVIMDSFRGAFCAENGFAVVAELESASLAEGACKRYRPGLVLMDVCTEGDVSGLDALNRLRPQFPQMKIILMSGFDELSYAPRAKELGADAFVFKSKGLDFFIEISRKVLAGETWFPEPKKIPMPVGEAPLTKREMEILRLLCMHMSNREIGEKLFISENTVKYHKANMLAKTGFSKTMDLVFHMINNGWINPRY